MLRFVSLCLYASRLITYTENLRDFNVDSVMLFSLNFSHFFLDQIGQLLAAGVPPTVRQPNTLDTISLAVCRGNTHFPWERILVRITNQHLIGAQQAIPFCFSLMRK